MNYNQYPSNGIDASILIIQNALDAHLGWTGLDVYGRVQKVLSKDGKKLTPEVHISANERKEVFYDDRNAPAGNIFFIDSDSHISKDGIQFTAKVKVVFMLNLSKIVTDVNYRADVEVQEQALRLIRKIRTLQITGIEKGLDNVLSGFNTEQVKKLDMQPFHIFSVNGDLNYTFNCKN